MENIKTSLADSALSREEFLRHGGILGASVIGAVGLMGSLEAGPALAKSSAGPVRNLDDLYSVWQRSLNSLDTQGLVALYEAGATFVTPQGQLVRGLAGITSQYAALIALNPNIDIFERHHVVSGHLALTSNRWRMTLSPKGGPVQKLHGGGLEVVRRGSDGGWRFVIDDASRMASPPA